MICFYLTVLDCLSLQLQNVLCLIQISVTSVLNLQSSIVSINQSLYIVSLYLLYLKFRLYIQIFKRKSQIEQHLIHKERNKSHLVFLSSQLYVLYKALIFIKICIHATDVLYLFHCHIELFHSCSFYFSLCFSCQWLCIKLAPSSAGISFMTQLFGIELAYSHNVLFRLFVGLMEINPVFLLISLCISLVCICCIW